MSACFPACEFKVTNQTQESVEVQEIWALNIAVLFETMEMDSLEEIMGRIGFYGVCLEE